MWPAMMVEITAMILLAVWTAQTNFGWKRLVLDDATGETMGQCSGDGKMVLLFLALALTLIPTVLTQIMAWKTMDVDEAFSESRWIFALILVQFQVSADCVMVPRIQLVCRSCNLYADRCFAIISRKVILVALPLVYILREVSSNGRYLGVSLILWTLSMTNIGLIIFPKIVALHFPQKSIRTERESSEGVRVSGLPVSLTPNESQNCYPSQVVSNLSET